MLNKIYFVIGTMMVFSYATLGFMGWELWGEGQETIPAEARTKDGYRHSTFWVAGFRGGK